METGRTATETVAKYLDTVWNRRDFERMDEFLHPDFVDHSLPSALPTSKVGTQKWIEMTGVSFEHKTRVDVIVNEGPWVAVKLRMELKHIGTWREWDATFAEIETVGYRFFRVQGQKILEHWALLDAGGIETQLKDAVSCSLGCKVQV